MDYHLSHDFPRLKEENYQVTSPLDQNYNCVGWAAGDNNTIWWPDAYNELAVWHDDLELRVSVSAFIKFFEKRGYSICSEENLEQGFEKVAIYKCPVTGNPEHAARQLTNGSWTSKLGEKHDIMHRTLNDLSGGTYGEVSVILKRQVGCRLLA